MRPLLFLPVLALAACSGGGGSAGGGGGAVANSPPAFTSAASASITENTSAAYQAAASDPDGDPVTLSIAGGADAARFTLAASGALTFNAPPNFEAPADADADNVYLVRLGASDGKATVTQDVQITVTNSREGIRVTRVGTGFQQPVFVAAIPNDHRVFVAEKTGRIWLLDPVSGAKTLVTTVTDLSTDGERGLLGLAVPTAAAARGLVRAGSANGPFLAFVTAADGALEVRYYVQNPAGPYVGSVQVRADHAANNNHNGGWMGFGPDGNLYVATGDGGGAGDPANNAQNPNARLGKIIRLAANPDPYAGASLALFIPAPGNPYASGGGDPWIWAWGLRNPFRASFAPDGTLVIADVGQDRVEEIDLVRTDQPGLNFGWPFLEGTLAYRGTAPAGLTAPVSQYEHGAGPKQGNSIIGGYVYRGPIAALSGLYVFADYVTGNLWTVPYASLTRGSLVPASEYERRNQDFAPESGTIDQIVSFGEDHDGNLYIVDLDGDIFRAGPG